MRRYHFCDDIVIIFAAILFGGIFLAVLTKWWLGDERISAYRGQFDGMATFLLLAFLVPALTGYAIWFLPRH